MKRRHLSLHFKHKHYVKVNRELNFHAHLYIVKLISICSFGCFFCFLIFHSGKFILPFKNNSIIIYISIFLLQS